jgi:type IV pilus assembly protein PilB
VQSLIQVIECCGLLAGDSLKKALTASQFKNQPLIEYLIQQHLLSAKTIAEACSQFYHLPFKDLSDYAIEILKALQPAHTKLQGIVLKQTETFWVTAITDPEQFSSLEDYQWKKNITMKIVFVEYDKFIQYQEKLQTSFCKSYHSDNTFSEKVQKILRTAINKKASDIHFEPHKFQYRIRVRVDGFLYELHQFDPQINQSITSCLKIMANLDIAETRLPQDGRFTFYDQSNKLHPCRLSTCRTLFGEKCVVRILENNKNLLHFHRLGFTALQQKIFIHALHKPHGLILVTGPTGSGKTISLYTALQYLNKSDKNIYSAEDPVEIELIGIHQVNINMKIGFTFVKALRAFLRQDPDIMMIGEIRDVETAQIAVRAAQTGHLVLSTLHTNNATDTIAALKKMGIHPFDLSETLQLIIAQRLIRKLCRHCKKTCIQTQQMIASGCSKCMDGYQGRIGIYELLPISRYLREGILSNMHTAQLRQTAQKNGMHTLLEAGFDKVTQGITSSLEIKRVLG